MPVKIGQQVSYKTPSGALRSGKYLRDSGKRAVIMIDGKERFAPKDKLFHRKVTKKPTKIEKAIKANKGKPVKKKPVKKTAPKKPEVNKDLLQNVMGIMAEVGKEKGKSTKKEVDSKVALDKKAQTGKLTQKAFLEDITLTKGYDDKNDDFFTDVTYNIMSEEPYAETEKQQQRLLDFASNRASTEISKYRRRLFNRVIKGKKFKSFKEAQETFLKDFTISGYSNEDD